MCRGSAPGFFCAILYKFQRASFGVAGLVGQLELAGFQKPGVEDLTVDFTYYWCSARDGAKGFAHAGQEIHRCSHRATPGSVILGTICGCPSWVPTLSCMGTGIPGPLSFPDC